MKFDIQISTPYGVLGNKGGPIEISDELLRIIEPNNRAQFLTREFQPYIEAMMLALLKEAHLLPNRP